MTRLERTREKIAALQREQIRLKPRSERMTEVVAQLKQWRTLELQQERRFERRRAA